MANTLILKEGTVAQEYLDLLQDIPASINKGSLEVINAVASNRDVGQFENAPDPKIWKRAIVSPLGSDIVFKLFFPGSFPRRFYYHYLTENPIRQAYRIHQGLSKTDTRALPSFGYGCFRGKAVAKFWFIAIGRLSSVISFGEYAKRYLANAEDTLAAQTDLSTYVAKRLADAHSSGFYHEDLKSYHIYIDDNADTSFSNLSQTSKWLWIDLDDSELRKSLSYRQCMINLYQSWRYLLRPHGINEPDEFIRSYLFETWNGVTFIKLEKLL